MGPVAWGTTWRGGRGVNVGTVTFWIGAEGGSTLPGERFRRKRGGEESIVATGALLMEGGGGLTLPRERSVPQKSADFAESRRYSQKTAGNRRLRSVTLGY